MTIHQSKGLEFPIVAVPDMDISNRKPSFPYMMDGKHGVISKRYREEVYEERQESEKDMESAERRRLYYVALTRARDFLILGKDSSDKKSKLDEVLEHACETTAFEGEKQIIASIPELHPKSRLEDILGELQRDGGQVERLASLWNRAAPYAVDPSLLGTFSVTLLEDFLECERRYHLKHLLERSTTLWMEPGERDDEESNRGASLGLLVHSFMEVWPLDKPASLEDVLDFFQAATKRALSSAENAAARSLAEFMAGPFMFDLREKVAGGAQVMQELPFISRIEWPDGKSMRLKGRVDLLLVPSEGALKLVDFKYARFDKSRHKRYALQVAAYAAALGKAWGERKIDCTIAYLSGSPQLVEVDLSGAEGQELLGHFENIVREAHSRSHLPFDRWRRCPESLCQNSHCRFSKLCGID